MCGNIACAVNTLDNEDDVPPIWRAEELGKLEGRKAEHPGRKEQEQRARPLQGELGETVGESCVVEYDDECDERDYCVPEDERASSKGDYVSLVDNPERFTGYGGPSAHQVWDAIYQENCFSKPSHSDSNTLSERPPFFGAQASSDLKSVFQDHSRVYFAASNPSPNPFDTAYVPDDECLEKRVFYRIISGMHASISTHLCWDNLNQTTGRWGPNLACYTSRLHEHPDRISNLYFNYALLLRAVAKLHPQLASYTFCSGDPAQDALTKRSILALTSRTTAPDASRIFDESLMFQSPTAVVNTPAGIAPELSKEDFRNRFRNVSRLMDCVGCDKCRLWGKLQTAGYGTALKILFEYDDEQQEESSTSASPPPPLRRTELVALINTLDRVSSSLVAVDKFRTMLAASRPHSSSAFDLPSTDQPAQANDDDYAEADENVDDEWQGETLGEAFRSEFKLVFRVFLYVLRSWVEFPRTVWHIALIELSRVWDYWLGLPITPRDWHWDAKREGWNPYDEL